MTAPQSASPPPGAAERILDATVTVLAERGVAGVSMRAVAQEAGVALGLASYYFTAKNTLIAAALERIGDSDLELVQPPDHLPPREQLRHCLRAALGPEYLTPRYLSSRLQLWSLAGVDPVYARINQRAQRAYLDALTSLVIAARPDLDRDETARRAADILIEQNGVWLTAVLVPDPDAVSRALARCERIAFD